jgi:hypothetical protein
VTILSIVASNPPMGSRRHGLMSGSLDYHNGVGSTSIHAEGLNPAASSPFQVITRALLELAEVCKSSYSPICMIRT